MNIYTRGWSVHARKFSKLISKFFSKFSIFPTQSWEYREFRKKFQSLKITKSREKYYEIHCFITRNCILEIFKNISNFLNLEILELFRDLKILKFV
jgi:hypothetical protein